MLKQVYIKISQVNTKHQAPKLLLLPSTLHLTLQTQLRVFEWGSGKGFTFHAQDSPFKYMEY